MKNDLGVILAVVLFGLLSIFFGVMAYMNYGDISKDVPANSLDAKINDQKYKIKEAQDKIDLLTETYRIKAEYLARANEDYASKILERDAYVKAYTQRQLIQQAGMTSAEQAQKLQASVSELKAKTLNAINKDTSLVREQMDKVVEDKNKSKSEAVARVVALKDEYEKSVKKHRADMNYQKSQLGDTRAVLQDLTQREPVHGNLVDRPDGKVIVSDSLSGFVAINLGTGSGVKPGYRFEVYAMRPGNKHVTKCFIEVTKAGITQSECIVLKRPVDLPFDALSGYLASQPEEIFNPLSQSGKKGASAEIITGAKTVMSGPKTLDPVLEGDLVQNPFFDVGRQLTFYIAGSKELIGDRQKSAIRYKWTEIKYAAERHGAKVVDRVDTNVNYIIAQKNPQDDPEYKNAVDLGIPIVYEWEFFRFLEDK